MPNNDELDSAVVQLISIIHRPNERKAENGITRKVRKKRMDDYLYRKEIDNRMRDIDL